MKRRKQPHIVGFMSALACHDGYVMVQLQAVLSCGQADSLMLLCPGAARELALKLWDGARAAEVESRRLAVLAENQEVG